MNIAYFGSPDISAELLKLLFQSNQITISLVVPQPDKPVGKKLEITPTAVKRVAQEKDIPVFDIDLRKEQAEDMLISMMKTKDITLCIVFAYGAILSDQLLEVSKLGFWNVHPSTLPLFRGPSPIAYPLLLGYTSSGVTLMQMVSKLDAGPVIRHRAFSIDKNDNRYDLEKKIPPIAYELISESILSLPTLQTQDQDHGKATYTKLLKKEHGYIPIHVLMDALSNTSYQCSSTIPIIHEYMKKYPQFTIDTSLAKTIYNLYRAFHSWPGIWTKILIQGQEKRVKIQELHVENNLLHIDLVQLEGKSIVPFVQFKKSYNVF